jgi:hypothetical protein
MEGTAITSRTHPLHIAEISPRAGWGVIGVSSCPGRLGGDDPDDSGAFERDLVRVHEWGAKAVLSALDRPGLDELGVTALPEQVRRSGMGWHHLPIRRRYPPGPAFERIWSDVRAEATGVLEAGERILIHCNEGFARAWTVAACLLVECGMAPVDALERVRSVQPRAIPLVLQEWYVINYRRQSS